MHESRKRLLTNFKTYKNMTTSKFKAANIVFTVTAKLSKTGVQFPFDNTSNFRHNEFNITIKTYTGKTTMKFYGSEMDYKNNGSEMDESDLKHALDCFVSDAASGDDNFESFCSNLGYDTDSRTAERIYKACVKQLAKFERVCPNTDIYNIINELND